jgi:hypothetical protein
MSQSYDALLQLVARRMREQERAGRISKPRLSTRRPVPTRAEMRAAVALADAVLAQVRPDLLSGAARLGAVRARAPQGDFSYRAQAPPTADQLALLEQLRMAQLVREHGQRKFLGPQGSYEPSGLKENAAVWLGALPAAFGGPAVGEALGRTVLRGDIRRQLLELSYIPSPPEAGRFPWSLLTPAELADVKRRLYAKGGPVAQRIAAGY